MVKTSIDNKYALYYKHKFLQFNAAIIKQNARGLF